MKTGLLSLLSALIIVLCFSSCMENLRMEKRHYRNGFYFNRNSHEEHATADTAIAVSGQGTSFSSVEAAAPVTESFTGDTAKAKSPARAMNDTAANAVASAQTPVEETRATTPDQQTQMQTPQPQAEKAPAEARTLNILWWIALGLLVLGVIAAIVAFLPFVSAGFGILIGSAPFLIVGALGLSIAVMVSARRREESAVSGELKDYYSRLKRRARLLVVLASSVIVVFLLFLILVIAALSNFQ